MDLVLRSRQGSTENYRTTHLKCCYNEIRIFPTSAILNNKTAPEEKFQFQRSLSVSEIFKFSKYAN